MKISNDTLSILKKFSEINTGLVFKEGNVQSTVSPQKNILLSAEVEENFPSSFAIYELNLFLGLLSSCKDPELEFNGTNLKIVESTGQVTNYIYSDPSMIVQPPEKAITFPNADIEFNLSFDHYESILKKAAILQLPEIAVVGEDGEMKLSALDSKNDSSNISSISLGNTEHVFKFIFKLENLKLFKGDYLVKISSKGISHFKNKNREMEYFIATEASSTFNS